MSLCSIKIQSPHMLLRDVSTSAWTPGGGLPEVLRATERPVRQRSGPAATEEWEGDAYPATHGGAGDPRCKRSSVWVRATAASKKACQTRCSAQQWSERGLSVDHFFVSEHSVDGNPKSSASFLTTCSSNGRSQPNRQFPASQWGVLGCQWCQTHFLLQPRQVLSRSATHRQSSQFTALHQSITFVVPNATSLHWAHGSPYSLSCGRQVPDVAIPHYSDARMQHSQSR